MTFVDCDQSFDPLYIYMVEIEMKKRKDLCRSFDLRIELREDDATSSSDKGR